MDDFGTGTHEKMADYLGNATLLTEVGISFIYDMILHF